jgi:hypothetical protein
MADATRPLSPPPTLSAEWNEGDGTFGSYLPRSDWSVEVKRNGPSLKMGSGFEVVVSRPFTWRFLDFEYAHPGLTM